MKLRSIALAAVLGLPALLLLSLGPRRQLDIPPDRTVVRYWEKWTGVEGQAMQRIVDRFNETQGAAQNIWVDYQAVANVDQRLLIATAGGDPPDIAGLFDHIVPQFADREALLPLDELCNEYEIDVGVFKPVWLEIGRYSGSLYALPSTPYTIALFYNRRLFREAGLDPDRPPQTIAELDEYARHLTRRDPSSGKIVQLGFTVSPAMLGWWHWIWPVFFDAQLWDGDRFRIDTPEGLAAMRWIRNQRVALGSVGLAAAEIDPRRANDDVLSFEATSGAIEGAQNPFLSERLAMVFQGPWLSNWIETYAPSLDYAVAPFPSITLDRPHHFASTDNFVIPRGSRHVREAMVFLKYVSRQPVLEELCSLHGKVSPFRTPLPGFYENHKNPYVRVFDEMAGSEHAFGYPAMPTWANTWTETLRMLETVLRGQRDADETVRATQKRVDQLVDEYQRMNDLRHAGASAE